MERDDVIKVKSLVQGNNMVAGTRFEKSYSYSISYLQSNLKNPVIVTKVGPLVKHTLQWTTTTWTGSLFSQESIDLIMLQYK